MVVLLNVVIIMLIAIVSIVCYCCWSGNIVVPVVVGIVMLIS